jgi:hypothetical protein
MDIFTCEKCGRELQLESVPHRGRVCFGCHIRTVSFGFTHGKEDFHGPTIKERQEKQMADARSAGINAEPVGNRWV